MLQFDEAFMTYVKMGIFGLYSAPSSSVSCRMNLFPALMEQQCEKDLKP